MYSALTSKQKLSARRIWHALIRKKTMDKSRMEQSELRRTLDLIDLTTIGIANTFGLGVYVFAGKGARVAGPAICVSHFIMGVATTLTALCYGELAATVPRSGSVYNYTYGLMGEFMAFIFGWLQCLENIIGVACLGGGLSTYIDNMIDNRLTDYFAEINIPVALAQPNVFAVFLIAICSCILVGGVELTVTFQKLLTFLNLTTLTIIIVIGVCNADLKNWSWKPGDEDFPSDGSGGSGGFFPFGFHGVLVIAQQGVYAYRGFEGISCAGEEAKHPRKLLPLAILLTLIIASVSYIGIAVALTLMWPYFDESETSPFPYALDMTNMHNVKWVVSTGILFCLCACLLGNTHTCSRALYSVGADGLIFKWLGKVNSKTRTPIFSTIATAFLSGAFAITFNTDMLGRTIVSVSNLVSHTVVSVCVLLLRYRAAHKEFSQDDEKGPEDERSLMEMLLNLKGDCKTPTVQSYLVVKTSIIVLLAASSMFSVVQMGQAPSNFRSSLVILCFIVIGFCIVVLMRQPQSSDNLPFKVPFVPLLPVASLLINMFFMMAMLIAGITEIWLMLTISTLLGLLIYFGYGLAHSVEANEEELSNFSSSQSNSS